jgi:hypothetical protein
MLNDLIYIIVIAFFTAFFICWSNGLFSMPKITPLEKTPELEVFIKVLEKKYAN